MFLSVIIPVYNEENTIIQILKKVNIQKKFIKLEVIISNDGSTDQTLNLLKDNNNLYDKLFSNKINMGKGHAIKKALKLVSGDVILIQDADLEYDPEDYQELLKPIENKITNIVYGSRVLNYESRYSAKNSFTSILRIFGNHMLTLISNRVFSHSSANLSEQLILKSYKLMNICFLKCNPTSRFLILFNLLI